MQEIDKGAMGGRIRAIRLGASLRQWELAKMLGTTQSAVHKYEHGVVPEPRRLVELARIGGTSIEWVLTGRHWENGSEEQARIPSEVLETASLFREINSGDRAAVNEALNILRDAVKALEEEETPSDGDREGGHSALREHSVSTLRLLETASRIQQALLTRVARESRQRLERSSLGFTGDPDGSSAAGRSGS